MINSKTMQNHHTENTKRKTNIPNQYVQKKKNEQKNDKLRPIIISFYNYCSTNALEILNL